MLVSPRGGKRDRAGRPHAEDPRTCRMMLRLSDAEDAIVRAAAALDDATPSEWVRGHVVRIAEQRTNREADDDNG